jgi:hypothetical protein
VKRKPVARPPYAAGFYRYASPPEVKPPPVSQVPQGGDAWTDDAEREAFRAQVKRWQAGDV